MPVREFHRCILYPCTNCSLLQRNPCIVVLEVCAFSFLVHWFTILRPMPVVLIFEWQQCSNYFGRFAKSRRLEPGNLSRITKDYRGADKGEAVRLNKPLEILSFNEMENKGSSSRQQRFSSTITSNRRISETRAPAEFSDATSPYVNQGTSCLLRFNYSIFYFLKLQSLLCMHNNKLDKGRTS